MKVGWTLTPLLCFVASAYRFVIVPGLLGSVLYKDGKRQIWPPSFRFDPMDLGMDHNFDHQPDFHRTIKNFGDVDSIRIDCQTLYFFTKTIYYSNMIDHLQERNHEVYGMPYDFRFVHLDYYNQQLHTEFKRFIEKEFESNRKEKFVIVAHSLGGLVIHNFLTSFVDRVWIKRFIKKVYYINTPFGGCPSALFTLLDNLFDNKLLDGESMNNNPILSNVKIRNFHMIGGMYVCLPFLNYPILKQNNRWTMTSDLERMFSIHPHTGFMYNRVVNDVFPNRRRSVEIEQVVVYGSEVDTPVAIDYDNHVLCKTSGDGLVPIESLTLPTVWKYKPHFVEVPGQEHSRINSFLPLMDMISDNSNELILENPVKQSSSTKKRKKA